MTESADVINEPVCLKYVADEYTHEHVGCVEKALDVMRSKWHSEVITPVHEQCLTTSEKPQSDTHRADA